MQRDRSTRKQLRAAGWQVLRVWEHDLKRKPQTVVGRISRLLHD